MILHFEHLFSLIPIHLAMGKAIWTTCIGADYDCNRLKMLVVKGRLISEEAIKYTLETLLERRTHFLKEQVCLYPLRIGSGKQLLVNWEEKSQNVPNELWLQCWCWWWVFRGEHPELCFLHFLGPFTHQLPSELILPPYPTLSLKTSSSFLKSINGERNYLYKYPLINNSWKRH